MVTKGNSCCLASSPPPAPQLRCYPLNSWMKIPLKWKNPEKMLEKSVEILEKSLKSSKNPWKIPIIRWNGRWIALWKTLQRCIIPWNRFKEDQKMKSKKRSCHLNNLHTTPFWRHNANQRQNSTKSEILKNELCWRHQELFFKLNIKLIN